MRRVGKLLAAVVVGVMAMSMVAGCGSTDGGDSKPKEKKEAVKEYIDEADYDELYTNPDKFKGKYVKISGQVFSEPERDGEDIYFQMWHEPDKAEGNTIVKCTTDQKLRSEDYVIVDGEVSGSFEGENMVGGKVTAPQITATSVEVSDYITVIAPTIKEVVVDETQEQYGYTVTVQKIEFAENETRVYVAVTNNGSDTFSCYGFNSKIIQEGKQISSECNYFADYPSIESELLKGASTEGIITFPALNPEAELELYIEGYSDNWEEQIDKYVYTIK